MLKLDLSHHPDKFNADSQKININKKINFVFGRNGTGKTTIADEIKDQLSADYDVCIFKDFDGVVENDRLNAVALGTENAKIQKDIEKIDRKIDDIKRQVEKPEDKKFENLFTKVDKSKKLYDDQKKKISAFYTSAARNIKNQLNPTIAKPSYDKDGFQHDIANANLLSDNAVAAHKKTIKADKKEDVEEIAFPSIDLSAVLEILRSSVSQTQDIPELNGNTCKQNFARQGMEIHEQREGEACAFCGNEISDERWQLLGNYFNDEVKKLESRIAAEIEEIDLALDSIKGIKIIKKEDFYVKFEQDINTLNLQITAKSIKYKEFLERLSAALEEKKSGLFTGTTPLEITIPANFS